MARQKINIPREEFLKKANEFHSATHAVTVKEKNAWLKENMGISYATFYRLKDELGIKTKTSFKAVVVLE